MEPIKCMPQKISKLMLGFILLGAAIGLIIIGITLLPVFGFIMAMPVLALSIYVFSLHLNKECEIDL